MADTRMITFALGRHRFAIPIEDIREVINIDSVVDVPGGRRPLEGILPYRDDAILPVFSLLDLLGLQVLDAAREPNGLSLAGAVRGEEEIPEDRVVFCGVTTGAETLRMAATASRSLTTYEGRGDPGTIADPAGSADATLERALREAFEMFARTALRSGRTALVEEERDQLKGIGYFR